MIKTPLAERIDRFAISFPFAAHIPIHPTEFYRLSNKRMIELETYFAMPLVPIGKKPEDVVDYKESLAQPK